MDPNGFREIPNTFRRAPPPRRDEPPPPPPPPRRDEPPPPEPQRYIDQYFAGFSSRIDELIAKLEDYSRIIRTKPYGNALGEQLGLCQHLIQGLRQRKQEIPGLREQEKRTNEFISLGELQRKYDGFLELQGELTSLKQFMDEKLPDLDKKFAYQTTFAQRLTELKRKVQQLLPRLQAANVQVDIQAGQQLIVTIEGYSRYLQDNLRTNFKSDSMSFEEFQSQNEREFADFQAEYERLLNTLRIADCATLIARIGEPRYSLKRSEHDLYIPQLFPKINTSV